MNTKSENNNSNSDSSDEKLEVEYRKLKSYHKNHAGKRMKDFHLPLPDVFDNRQIDKVLAESTKKACDNAAYINYKKSKDTNREIPGGCGSIATPNGSAADRAAEARYRTLTSQHGRTVRLSSKDRLNGSFSEDRNNHGNNNNQELANISMSHSYQSVNPSDSPRPGAFLATTTRQLNRPLEAYMEFDSERTTCKKARAKNDFTAKSDREMSLKKNEFVWVHGEVDRNWYHGEKISAINSEKGWFPKNFVEIITGNTKIQNFRVLEYGHAEVLFDITGRNSEELTAYKGDRILLIKKEGEEWWLARTENDYLKTQKGRIPDVYIKVTKSPVTSEGVHDISQEHEKLNNIRLEAVPVTDGHTNSRNSTPSQADLAKQVAENAASRLQARDNKFSVNNSNLNFTKELDRTIEQLEVNNNSSKQSLSHQAMQAADPSLYDFKGPANKGKSGHLNDPRTTHSNHEDIEKRVRDYEQEISSRQISGVAPSFLPQHAERYRANCDYNPRDTEHELKLRENDILWVLQKDKDGIYFGYAEKSGEMGQFPASNVEPF